VLLAEGLNNELNTDTGMMLLRSGRRLRQMFIPRI